MDRFSVIITSFYQRQLTLNCIKSYLKFCPSNIKPKFIVVENSADTSYKQEVMALSKDIVWVNNDTRYRGANANANGIEVGMKYVDDDFVFLSHNDVCITSEYFFTSLQEKICEGHCLIGTCYDAHPLRNHSIIVLGCMVKSDIVKSVDLYPLDDPQGRPRFECGDRIHIYCREHNIKHMCFKNTFNNPDIRDELPDMYRNLLYTLTTIDHNGHVIFLHFSRGTPKTNNTYPHKGRMNIAQIISFCENKVFKHYEC